ncbi:Usp47, partial [Symbiodinium sp. KB8]
ARDLQMAASEDGSIAPADLSLYRQLREAVESAVRKNGSQFFAGRPEAGPASLGGLLNQGATCYLNSLVQALFHSRPFRQLVYAWCYDESVHGAAEACIPLQLQRLFARLQLSKRAATSTKALTRSFGWTAADSFQQHDAQELLHLLVDALDTTADGDERRAKQDSGPCAPEPSPLRLACDALRGKVLDRLQCCVCGHSRSREDPYLDVELEVSGSGTAEAAVRRFHGAELLTGGDQWHCDSCGKRRDAVKSMTLSAAPPVLMLHLKRFGFDMATMRRAKLMDSFLFPAELRLGDIVAGALAERASEVESATAAARERLRQRLEAQAAGPSTPDTPDTPDGGAVDSPVAAADGDDAAAGVQLPALHPTADEAVAAGVAGARYRLSSVLIHTGTAMGGHYFAYARPGEAFPFAAAHGLCAEAEGGDRAEAGWVELNDAGARLLAGDAALSLRRVMQAAVGGAAAGDAAAGDASSVGMVAGEAAVEASEEGGDAAADAGAAAADSGAGGVAQAAPAAKPKPSVGVEGNAYLLVYARCDDASDAAPAAVQGRELPPDEVLKEVEAENAAWERLKRAFDVRTRLCRLQVRWPPVRNGDVAAACGGRGQAAPVGAAGAGARGDDSAAVSSPPRLGGVASGEAAADDGAAARGPPKDEADEDTNASGVEVPELETAMRATSVSPAADGGEARSAEAAVSGAVLEAPVSWTTGRLLREVCRALGPDADAAAFVGRPGVSLAEAAELGLLRLRRWDAVGGRPTAVIGGDASDGTAAVSSLGLGAGSHVCLEGRREGEEWVPYDPQAMVLALVRWDPDAADAALGVAGDAEDSGAGGAGCAGDTPVATPAFTLEERLSLMSKDTVLVPGGAAATCGGLSAAVASSELGVPVSMQRLWAIDGDSARRLDPACDDVRAFGGDAASLWDLGLAPGARVIVEVVAPAEATDGAAAGRQAGFKAAFDAERSVIEIQFNLPSKPSEAAPEGVRWAADSTAMAPDFSERVLATKQDTLAELKRRIAAVLGPEVDPEDFHLARSARSREQLKDGRLLLGDSQRAQRGLPPRPGLGLVNGSVVHVRWGRQLRADEHMVSFLSFDPSQAKRSFAPLCSLPVCQDATVASVKRLLRDALVQQHADLAKAARDAAAEAPKAPPALSRLRLRDKTRTEAGKILRDSQRLGSALPRLGDGYEIAVQRLAEPETVSAGDLVVECRRWNPATFKLSPVTELVLDKHATLRDLRGIVARKFRVTAAAKAAAAGAGSREGPGLADTPSAASTGADSALPEGEVLAPWAVGLAKHTQFAAPLRGASAGESLTWMAAEAVTSWAEAWDSAGARGKDAAAAGDDAAAAAAAIIDAKAATARERFEAAVREERAIPLDEAELVAFGQPPKPEGAAQGGATRVTDSGCEPASPGAGAGGADSPVSSAAPKLPARGASLDVELDRDDAKVVAKPLALRDGVTLVIRDERSRLQAVRAGLKPPVKARAAASRRTGRSAGRGARATNTSGSAPRVRERGLAFRQGGPAESARQPRQWSCPVCTFEQTNPSDSCEMCGSPAPA